MAEFRRYPSIHRLGKEETEGILDTPVVVSEKLDGANFSIFYHDGKVRCGTRSRMLPEDESFRGGQEIVLSNQKLIEFMENNQELILYGELLVRHTIVYDPSYYNKVYLFEVYDSHGDQNWSQDDVERVALEVGLEYPIKYGEGLFTVEDIQNMASRKDRGVLTEGVVIKSLSFVNKFGDRVHAKYVNDIFKEKNNQLFGNYSKQDPLYHELRIASEYVTLARVEKIVNKTESALGRKVKIEDTPRIIGQVQYDVITEEAWEIFKKAPAINNKALRGMISNRARTIYHDILSGVTSVAYDK